MHNIERVTLVCCVHLHMCTSAWWLYICVFISLAMYL